MAVVLQRGSFTGRVGMLISISASKFRVQLGADGPFTTLHDPGALLPATREEVHAARLEGVGGLKVLEEV
jgi:hypothetical protein